MKKISPRSLRLSTKKDQQLEEEKKYNLKKIIRKNSLFVNQQRQKKKN